MSDIEKIKEMLERAGIDFEIDDKTYPQKKIIRIKKHSYVAMKKRTTVIFDFSKDGELLNVE